MLTATEKFAVLHRDSFTCMYCGSKPGSGGLEVDHLIPVSLGGSDNQENLVSSCVKCNRGKLDGIYMPHSMIEAIDRDGWCVHRSFGIWAVKFCKTRAVIESSFGYWFELTRAFEPDWIVHIKQKSWDPPHKLSDFIDCLSYAKRLMNDPRTRRA